MPSPYVPGPTSWYISSGANGAFEYLGMCEGPTRLTLAPQWDEVYTDGSGSRVPYDLEFQGAEATVSGELVHYNEGVLNRCKNWINNPGGAAAGTFAAGTIGTLARTEGKAFALAIVSSYGTKAVYQNANMNKGFLFNFAVPIGSWDVALSAKVKRERILWRCLPVAGIYSGGGVLYTNDLSGLTLPSPT